MKLQKKLLGVVILTVVTMSAFAQTERTSSSVESVYLQSYEDVIISELAASENYEAKLISLEYIKEAVDSGRVSPSITKALYSLSGEGVFTMAREAGRLANNYPDVRRDAALMLSNVPSVETKDMLIDIIRNDPEPMVLSAAIYSLGEIGIIEEDDVVDQIAHMHKRFAVLNPTDSLASSILETFEKLLPMVEDQTIIIETVASIATNYNYVIPVREKAHDILTTIKQNQVN